MGAVEKQNETFVIKLRSYCFVIEYLIYRFDILKSQYIEYLKCSYSLTLQTHLVGVFLPLRAAPSSAYSSLLRFSGAREIPEKWKMRQRILMQFQLFLNGDDAFLKFGSAVLDLQGNISKLCQFCVCFTDSHGFTLNSMISMKSQ